MAKIKTDCLDQMIADSYLKPEDFKRIAEATSAAARSEARTAASDAKPPAGNTGGK